MAKEIKKPDERRREILLKAQGLFYEKGYAKTSVQTLVDSLSLAKGTFYYYFKSKDDLLSQLVDLRMVEISTLIDDMLADQNQTPLEQLKRMLSLSASWKADNVALVATMMEAVYRPDNIVLRQKTMKATVDMMSPVMAKIIEKGISCGEFLPCAPEITAQMILYMAEGIGFGIYDLVVGHEVSPEVLEKCNLMFDSYLQNIERILGVPQGTLKVYTMDQVQRILGGKNDKD